MKIVSSILAILLGIFIIWPSPIDSLPVTPSQPLPLTNELTPNDLLQSTMMTRLPAGASGGEDVALDIQGCRYTGVDDGSIYKLCPGDEWKLITNTKGRPLGLAFNQQGDLIIADALRGLLSMTPKGELTVLVNQFNNQPLLFVDDVDIAPDGIIYFSDASAKWSFDNVTYDAFEGRPSGRLFAYNPLTQSTQLLASDLSFANGVATSERSDFVLVVETFRYQVKRIWLTGEKAGQQEVLIDKLPGIPDGVARGANNTFWVAIYGKRSALLDGIHEMPWLKNLIAKLPASMTPMPAPYGFVIQIDAQGNILQSLHDRAAVSIGNITSVQPEDDGLHFGTLHMHAIGHLSF